MIYMYFYSFVTNYHKLGNLNQHTLLISQSCSSEDQGASWVLPLCSYRPKSRNQEDCFLFDDEKEESVPKLTQIVCNHLFLMAIKLESLFFKLSARGWSPLPEPVPYTWPPLCLISSMAYQILLKSRICHFSTFITTQRTLYHPRHHVIRLGTNM